MSENPSRRGRPTQGPGESFGFFLAAGIGGNALGVAAFVGSIELILGAPVRSLAAPYVALLVPGFVLPPFLYWARLARDRPRSCALRFAIGMLAWTLPFTLALGFSAVWLHILSFDEAVDIVGPLALLGPASAFAAAYIAVRQFVKAPQSA